MYRSQSNYIRGLSKAEYSMLREMCIYANNLYNKALYEIRQHFFRTGQYLRYESNYHICKGNENFKLLQAQTSQQVLMRAGYAFKSFLACLRKSNCGECNPKTAKMPHYQKKGWLAPLIISVGHGGCYITDGLLNIPQSRKFFNEHGKHRIKIKVPERLIQKQIKEIHIIPELHGRTFRIEYVYLAEPVNLSLNHENSIAIDFGVSNLASCITNRGASFIMDGRRIKSLNHRWNQECSRLQAIYAKQGIHTGKRLQQITIRRNNQVIDFIRKTARYIINFCIAHDIGTVIAVVNTDMKSGINLGHVNNQNSHYIPFAYLRLLLKSHCEFFGLSYIEQEESYTSKASAYDLDPLPIFDSSQREAHTFSGKRIKRGLYRTASGRLINADINGAANIMRKCKQNGDFSQLCRGLSASPQRIRLI